MDSFPCPGVMLGPWPPTLRFSPPLRPGKTSLAHQFLEGKFMECYEPTVESSKCHTVGGRGEGKLPAQGPPFLLPPWGHG